MKNIFLSTLVLLCTVVQAQDTLFVYGPGGPQAAMEAAGKRFSEKFQVAVKVIAGPETKWIDAARQNADLVFGGAEYMLTQFSLQHPGMIDSTSRVELYRRSAGILVRPGNPKKIRSIRDLVKPGIRILDVNGAGQLGMWEDIAGRSDLIGPFQKNISGSFVNTALAIEAWKKDTSYDAWITYSSWHLRLKDITSLVKIPAGQTIYRGTPIAIAMSTDQRETAVKFIRFLQTKEAHKIFIHWGWE